MGDLILLSLDPSFMFVACHELTGGEPPPIVLQTGVEDPFLTGVGQALLREVEQGAPSGRLYAEVLFTSLAAHLVRRYSAAGKTVQTSFEGLGRRQLRTAVEFIEEHLGQEISLLDISSAVGLSPFHFARLFKQSAGVAPYQYVLKRRVEEARRLLLRGDLGIADVALKVGFSDQSHFTRHFRRASGLTPGEFVSRLRCTAPARYPASNGRSEQEPSPA